MAAQACSSGVIASKINVFLAISSMSAEVQRALQN
jgi:hypothetical protein